MNKILKIFMIVLIIIMLIGQVNYIYAVTPGEGESERSEEEEPKPVIEGADDFLKKGKKGAKELDDNAMNALKTASDTMYNTLTTIGVALTVVIGGILGLNFMFASAADKAKIKELLVPYIIGCIVIYGAFAIWKVVAVVGTRFGGA